MKGLDIKKKLLEGLMGNMDDLASKKFKSVKTEKVDEPEGNPLRDAARKIYEALNGGDIPLDDPKTPEDNIRKEAEEKVKDLKMDKLAEALGEFIDSYKRG